MEWTIAHIAACTLVWILCSLAASDLSPGCALMNKTVPEILVCSGPQVTQLPTEVPKCLAEIHVTEAYITVLSANAISGVRCLKVIEVTNSSLETIERGVFDHLGETLNNVTLTGNQLKTLPEGLFAKLASLTSLYLNGNGLETLDSVLSGLKQVRILKARYNSIVNVSRDLFKDLTSVHTIDLSDNDITSVNFSHLLSLQNIKIDNNFLTSVDGAFAGLRNVQVLSIANNLISSVSTQAFEDLEQLTYLDISRNQIKILSTGTFENSKILEVFIVSPNPLENIDNALPVDSKLTVLNLSHCQFSTFPKHLPRSLLSLSLSRNYIMKIRADDTRQYGHLTTLVLDENLLENVTYGALTQMESLAVIALSGNRLRRVPVFPPSVTDVHLDNNQIQSVSPDSFAPGTKLNVLSLKKNNITSIETDSFKNMVSIQQLHFDNNPIDVLENNSFLLVHGLKRLFLNRLNLMAIYPDCFLGLTSLIHLEMAFVTVNTSNIDGCFFQNTANLETLILRGSPQIASSFLASQHLLLAKLRELNLMENSLETLDKSLFALIPNVKVIFLSGNKFHCTISSQWLSDIYYLNKALFHDLQNVSCQSPKHLQGRRIIDLKYSDFSGDTSTEAGDYSDYPAENPTTDDGSFYQYFFHVWYTDQTDSAGLYGTTEGPVSGPTSSTGNHNETATSTYTAHVSYTPTTSFQGDQHRGTSVPRVITKTSSPGSRSARRVGIAIGTSLGVIAIMLALAFILYKSYMFSQSGSRQIDAINNGPDYVFVLSNTQEPAAKENQKVGCTERDSSPVVADDKDQIEPNVRTSNESIPDKNSLTDSASDECD